MFLHSDNDTSPVFRIYLNSGQAFCNNHLILPFEASSPPEFPPEFLRFHPMKGDIDSLNASVAAGVLAFEVVRQRLGK